MKTRVKNEDNICIGYNKTRKNYALCMNVLCSTRSLLSNVSHDNRLLDVCTKVYATFIFV